MRPSLRKILALIVGAGIAIGSVVWSWHSSDVVAQAIGFKIGLASEFQEGDAVYKKFSDIYIAMAFVGVSLAAGLSFTLLAWERRSKNVVMEAIYWILLAIALPMTVINYWSADLFVSRSQQALLNVALCVLGIVCVAHILRVSTHSAGASVLKGLVIFFLAFQAVLVPAIYTILWWLNLQKAIFLADAQSFAPGWISAVSGIGALVVSILQYRISAAKAAKEQESIKNGLIILDGSQRR